MKGRLTKTLKEVIPKLIDSFDKELFSKSQEELEEYWFFKYDDSLIKEQNLYEFTKMLELYRSSCERWEEHHNGSVCIVERVRDKYLWNKIQNFIKDLR